MKNQIVIITGGSKGYGTGIAQVLKQRGAEVWITGRNKSTLAVTADRLGVHAVVADATRPADWDRLFKEVLAASGGRLDVLVNNAGAGIKIAPMADQTDAAMEECIALNLLGPLYGCRRAAPIMKAQGSGLIVNISSGCALHAWPGWGPYSAAKAGLNQLGHCLYTELREHNVRVTNVTPYWGATGFREASHIAAAEKDVEQKMMQPLEMGELVANLCAMPAHLVVPDITVQPLVQEIVPL